MAESASVPSPLNLIYRTVLQAETQVRTGGDKKRKWGKEQRCQTRKRRRWNKKGRRRGGGGGGERRRWAGEWGKAIDTVVTGTARRERREMGRDRGSEKAAGERFIRGDGRSGGRGDGRRRGVRLKEIEGERGEMGRVGGGGEGWMGMERDMRTEKGENSPVCLAAVHRRCLNLWILPLIRLTRKELKKSSPTPLPHTKSKGGHCAFLHLLTLTDFFCLSCSRLL